MCRNIKVLRNTDGMPTDGEIKAAALQFVRKISGYHTPSKANQQVFDRAVQDISRCAREMFENLEMRVRV